MIQPSELRIGNFVLLYGKEVAVDLISEDGINEDWEYNDNGGREKCYVYEFNRDYNSVDDLTGIPITEQWFVNLGFKIDKWTSYTSTGIAYRLRIDNFLINYVILNYISNDELIALYSSTGASQEKIRVQLATHKEGTKIQFYLEITTNQHEDPETEIDLDGKIKFVHQLQNYVFALTGEELTIKS